MFEFSISGNRWFDRLAQPVLLLRGGVIQYRNPAAQRLLPDLKEGSSGPDWLPEADNAVTAGQLEGQRWIVTASATETGTICLFRPEDEGDGLTRVRVGRLSGQLRVLLGQINLSSEALEDALVETEQLRNRQWIARLNQSRYQLRRMVGDLDFYSQEEESLRLLYPPSLLELGALCRELEWETEALAELLGRRFVCQILSEPSLVSANRELLRRLLLNLLTNAFQAEGDVTLRLENKGDTVRLTMADSGRGIRPERLPKVFFPEGGQDELPAPGEGCGLGLPLCRKIAELYRGQLLLTSDGTGTRVSLSLPLSQDGWPRLHSAVSVSPAESAEQVLTELSPVLPADCFRQEDL